MKTLINMGCIILKKCAAQLIVAFTILMVLFGSGCSTISPKLQDEYRREDLSDGVRKTLDQYRQNIAKKMTKNKIPGLSLALVDCNGIMWSAGFGYTDYNQKKPVTADTLFLINSMSKLLRLRLSWLQYGMD